MADSNLPAFASASPFFSGPSSPQPANKSDKKKIIVMESGRLTSKGLTPDLIFET
jgi:hypothetical protein